MFSNMKCICKPMEPHLMSQTRASSDFMCFLQNEQARIKYTKVVLT